MKRVIIVSLILLLFVRVFIGCSKGGGGTQPKTSQVNVEVVDDSGNVLSGVSLTMGNYSGTTESNGKYTFSNVNSGDYTVKASKTGYDSANSNISLGEGETKTVILTLKTTVAAEDKIIMDASLGKNFLSSIEGTKVLFTSNDEVYVGDLKGKVLKIAASTSNNKNNSIDISNISSDRKWIICVLNNNMDSPNLDTYFLYALNLETLESIKIAQTVWEASFNCSFIGNSHRLIYSVKGVNEPLSYIAIYDLDKKTNKYLLEGKDDKDYAFFFDISEDGRCLAYVGGKQGIFPDSTASLWLKDLETGDEKILVKGEEVNSQEQYLGGPKFINNSKILYSLNTLKSSSYFVVGFNGHVYPAKESEMQTEYSNIESTLKKSLNKNLHVDLILKSCNKIVFTVFNDNGTSEEVWESSLNGSDAKSLNILNPNFIVEGENTCNFTYQVSSTYKWYLMDLGTGKQIDLNELYNIEKINGAIVLD